MVATTTLPPMPSKRISSPASLAPRRPGRPAAGIDAAGQRERLIDAATALFSERGVGATSVKAIAARAGVTPALVHYYFPTRVQLLDAVADYRLGPMVDSVFTAEAQACASPADMLGGIAERMIREAAARPWFPALWVREIVSPDGQLRDRVLQRIGLQHAVAVAALVGAARARGELDPAIQPPLVIVSVFGIALLPLATRHIWQQLPGANAIDIDSLVRHARAVLAHGMTPAARAAGGPPDRTMAITR
jgi:AcrR family transcriptional regulator